MSEATTHRDDTVCIDEVARQATGSIQWLLEHEHIAGTHPIRSMNAMEVLICGEEAFGRIAADIEAAQSTIDLICWGFDPAMELIRGRKKWPRGVTYGDLLQSATARGVKVRLLSWREGVASWKQNNLPGLTGDQRGGTIGNPLPSAYAWAESPESSAQAAWEVQRTTEEERNDYAVDWWKKVDSPAKTVAATIEFRSRRGTKEAVVRSLRSEQDAPSAAQGDYGGAVNERSLLEDHATHHQKTILIDYAHEHGTRAVGYVMGLNSTTDYWDTQEHLFDDARREVDWARASATAKSLPDGHAISRDPYHDYVCRIAGRALEGVHRNFVDAWVRAGGKARPDDAGELPQALPRSSAAGRVQIVRTQPEENDKTIKATYFHAVQFARRYLYVENQYFFYESWARHLKRQRATFMKALQANGQCVDESPLLHLFVVTPWPEDDGMVPRTYDTMKSLGEADSFPNQNAAMAKTAKQVEEWDGFRARAQEAGRPAPARMPETEIYRSAAKVQAPEKNHTTQELVGLGIKVLIARLVTVNRGKKLPPPALNHRQVYVHSKLMIIDDSFITLGSANLNQRSMSADSEINVASDDRVQATATRSRVWGLHSGGFGDAEGLGGDQAAIVAAFGDWMDLMRSNKRLLAKGLQPQGLLLQFVDERVVNFRHG